MLVEGVQPCLLSPMMSKFSIFVSAIRSSIFDGSDWPFSESTLSVFGCQCGGGGGGCGGDGGVCGGVMVVVVVVMVVVGMMVVVVVVLVVGGGGGDFGREECFHGLFMGFPLEAGCLPHFPTWGVGTF